MKHQYKVLHITNGAEIGGISAVILNYYRNIDREQFRFDFVIPPGKFGPNGQALEKLGGTFYTLPQKSEKLFAFIKELRELIKKNHYDIVHAHHHDTSYVSLFVALSCGVKCRVAQSHSYMVTGEKLKTKIRRRVGILLNDLSSNLRFACTDEAASYLFGKRLKRLFPVTLLPNGIEPESFHFSDKARLMAREEFGIDDNTLVFGVVARMTPEKNHRFLIDVLAEMLRTRKSVRLLVVGGGPLRNELEEFARAKGVLGNTIFAGKRPDLLNMLCAMDVFTLPSFYEGSPVSAVEAAATGLPIVLSCAITKDLRFLKNVAYVSIGDGDEEKWANRIIEFASIGRDTDSLSRINDNGFNVSSIAKLLSNSYLKRVEKWK